MAKKLVSIILCVILLASFSIGCGQKATPSDQPDEESKVSENSDGKDNTGKNDTADSDLPEHLAKVGFQKEGYPIVKEKVNISVFGLTHSTLLGSEEDWEKNTFWTRLEEKTNVHFDFKKVVQLGKTWREQMNLAFASGDFPDIFFKAQFKKLDEMLYGRDGALIPLEGLIDAYMPNLKKLMEDDPEIRKSITTPDGHIYSFPGINMNDILRVQTNLIINHVWLEKLGLKEPTNLDEFYNVLKAFKEQDPNGNGEQDEIPLCLTGVGDLLGLMRMFGYMYGENGMFLDPDLDDTVFVPSLPEFKDFLKYMNRLYAEGLMDPESFTNTPDIRRAKGSGEYPRIGLASTNSPGLVAGGLSQLAESDDLSIEKNRREFDYKFMIPIKAPNGRQFANCSPKVSTGKSVITKICKHPEVVARWMDFFYTDEGGEYLWAGVEGKDHRINDKGELEWLDTDGNPVTPDKANDVRKRCTLQPGGNYPALEPNLVMKIDKNLVPLKEPLVPYIYRPLPSFYFEPDSIKRVNTISADINAYIEQFTANAVTGKIDIDTEWDNFQNTLKQMGAQELLDIYKKAYESYKNN